MMIAVSWLLLSLGTAILLAASFLALADIVATEAVSRHFPAWTWLVAAGAAVLALFGFSMWTSDAAVPRGGGRLPAAMAGILAGGVVAALQLRAGGFDTVGIVLAAASGFAAGACAAYAVGWPREARQ